MNDYSDIYGSPMTVAQEPVASRAQFIRKTYVHVAFAVLAFAIIEGIMLRMGFGQIAMNLISTSKYSWLLVLGGFMGVSWLSDKMARNATSKGLQYAGLSLFVVGEAIIFLPMMFMAYQMADGTEIIKQAGLTTLALFGGLTAIAMFTRKDFSFLRGFLVIGGFVAMGLIVCSILFGFNLGTIFSGAMILFMSVVILYQTSQIIHHYRTDQYVAASLGIFSSIATMFWYVLRIFMSRD